MFKKLYLIYLWLRNLSYWCYMFMFF